MNYCFILALGSGFKVLCENDDFTHFNGQNSGPKSGQITCSGVPICVFHTKYCQLYDNINTTVGAQTPRTSSKYMIINGSHFIINNNGPSGSIIVQKGQLYGPELMVF